MFKLAGAVPFLRTGTKIETTRCLLASETMAAVNREPEKSNNNGDRPLLLDTQQHASQNSSLMFHKILPSYEHNKDLMQQSQHDPI